VKDPCVPNAVRKSALSLFPGFLLTKWGGLPLSCHHQRVPSDTNMWNIGRPSVRSFISWRARFPSATNKEPSSSVGVRGSPGAENSSLISKVHSSVLAFANRSSIFWNSCLARLSVSCFAIWPGDGPTQRARTTRASEYFKCFNIRRLPA
jgi:hypothetical protein